jgi:hypothetical protein
MRRNDERPAEQADEEVIVSGIFDFEQQMLPAWAKAAATIHRLGGRITAREFGRHSWMFRQVPRSMLQTMVARGYGRWEDAPRGPTGGRPTGVFVLADDIDETGARRPASPSAAPTSEVLS